MSRKNFLNHTLVESQSLSASFESQPTVVKHLDNLSYQIVVTTSDSQGTFTVQCSNDYDVAEPGTKVTNPGNWVDLTLSGVPSVSAANDDILISLNQVPFKAIRLKYTSTVAGTGVAKIVVMDKMIGG